jgi:ParB/RepB/Spo0J family partition protein
VSTTTQIAAQIVAAPAAPAAASVGSTVLPLDRVQAHPLNPRGADGYGALDDLAASITQLGVLEPVLAMPLAAAAAAWSALAPEIRLQLAGGGDNPFPGGPAAAVSGEWVLLAGHRRAAAARLAGLEAVPAVVREDLAADPAAQVAVMAAENIARQDLDPLAEARSFSALAGAGWSQRKIAAAAGCSPGQVAKRVSLLRLPAEVQTKLAAGQIRVSEALEFAGLAGEDVELAGRAWRLWQTKGHYRAETPAGAVAVIRETVTHETRRSAAAIRLQRQGIEVIDPETRWPAGRSWRQRLYADTAVEQARQAGHLVAHIETDGEIRYYTTVPAQDGNGRTQDDQARDRRERGRAIKARALICHQLAHAGPAALMPGPDSQTADVLATALIRGANADAVQLAAAWTTARPGDKPDAAAGTFNWRADLLDAGDGSSATRIRAAYALALAADEVAARWTYSTWGSREVAHLARLQAAGYQPTEWEQERLGAHAAQTAHASRPLLDVLDDLDDDQDSDEAADPAAGQADDQDQAAAVAPRDAGWVLGPSVVDGWSLWQLHGEPDGEPVLIEAAGVDINDDDVNGAQQWANEILVYDYGLQIVAWSEANPESIKEMEFNTPVWLPNLAAA